MEKVLVEKYIVDSIEYMRSQDGLSLYGIVKSINEESNSELFNSHSKRILKYFNDFDNRVDDENFMKCMLGYYDIKSDKDYGDFKIICPRCNEDKNISIYSALIECNNCKYVQEI